MPLKSTRRTIIISTIVGILISPIAYGLEYEVKAFQYIFKPAITLAGWLSDLFSPHEVVASLRLTFPAIAIECALIGALTGLLMSWKSDHKAGSHQPEPGHSTRSPQVRSLSIKTTLIILALSLLSVGILGRIHAKKHAIIYGTGIASACNVIASSTPETLELIFTTDEICVENKRWINNLSFLGGDYDTLCREIDQSLLYMCRQIKLPPNARFQNPPNTRIIKIENHADLRLSIYIMMHSYYSHIHKLDPEFNPQVITNETIGTQFMKMARNHSILRSRYAE